jgi:hypothetical protein
MSEASSAVAPADDVESLALTQCRLYRRSQIAHLARPIPWVWHGFLARRNLTLLTGQWKIGKTTLLAALLARLEHGGTLAGRRVEPGRAVVITEEDAGYWLLRMAKHDIGEAVSFAFRPYLRKPEPRQWQFLLDDLADLNRCKPIELVVIDPLIAVLPGREESSAQAMTDALRPLRLLADTGPAVLILHHPRKGRSRGGQDSRGTGALPAFVDFLIEMNWSGSPGDDNRRRQFSAWSRHEDTPRRLHLELAADGRDYDVLADCDDITDDRDRTLLVLLRQSPGRTAQEIVRKWPVGVAPMRLRELTDRLRRLGDTGVLKKKGRGDRWEPWRWSCEREDGVAELVRLLINKRDSPIPHRTETRRSCRL